MTCNRCGNEFGDGDVCEYCGSDKVTAFGEFSGYSIPKITANTELLTNVEPPIPSHSVSPHVQDIPSLICWKCGEVIPGDSKYCPVCGVLLFVNCPNCGHKYSANYPHCNQCGTNREEYQKAKELESLMRELEERNRKEERHRRIQDEARREAEERNRLFVSKMFNPRGDSISYEPPKDPIYDFAFQYIKKMANYLEQLDSFENMALKVKMDILEKYFSKYEIVNPSANYMVFIIIRNESYWNGRDCLDEKSLEQECIWAYTTAIGVEYYRVY